MATTNPPINKLGHNERQRLKKLMLSVLLDKPDREANLPRLPTSPAAKGESLTTAAQTSHEEEDVPRSQLGSNKDGDVNLIAAHLWNRLFNSKDYREIAGNREFFINSTKLLSPEANTRMSKEIESDILKLKAKFLKSKETDIDTLKLALQEQFTKLILRHIGAELARSKEETVTRVIYLVELKDLGLKKQAEVQEKGSETNRRVAEARDRINELLKEVHEHLVNTCDEDSAVGTPKHTLRLIYKKLNLPVINLPKIRNGIRINKEKVIYRSEFNQLPTKIKECFDYSVAWTEMADKSVAAERRAIEEYNILLDEMGNDNQIRKQIADLKEKLTSIKTTESVAEKIGEAQTFWKYEGVPAPGDDEKTPITADTSQLIINDLKDVTATFERLNHNRNTVKLQEEILCTKEYLEYLKSILVMFTNTDSIQTTIDETEDSIMIYDGIITRRIQEAEKFYDTFREEKSHSRVGKLNNRA